MKLAWPEVAEIKVGSFEGPYDLLLELVRARKIELSDTSLADVSGQFISYLKREPGVSGERIADFLVVAATLLLIKLRAVATLSIAEEKEVESLTSRLTAYQRYREAAKWLGRHWSGASLLSAPANRETTLSVGFRCGSVKLQRPAITAQQLRDQLKGLVQRRRPLRAPVRTAHLARTTLQECLSLVEQRALRLKRFVLSAQQPGNGDDAFAVTFMAALELARRQRISLHQAKPFAPIMVIAIPRDE